MNQPENKLVSIFKSPKALMRGLIIVSSIFLISLLFPTQHQFNYDFEKGKTWNYPDLTANADCYVWKTKTELKAESEETVSRFRPIFTKTTERKDIYDSLIHLLDAHRTELNELDYTQIRESLLKSSTKEILSEADLSFSNHVYQIVRIENAEGYTEMRPENYITVSKLQDFLKPLLGIISSNEVNILPTLALSADQSKVKLNLSLDDIPAYKRKILAGDLIVSKGDVISEKIYESLIALKSGAHGSDWHATFVFLGYIILTCLIIGVFSLYLFFHFPDLFLSRKNLGFLLMLIVGMSFLVYSVEHSDNLSSYLIPFCIVPIVVKSFYSDRLALFTHIVIVLIASFLSVLNYEFTFLQILAGIVAVLVIEDTRSWNKFFISIFSILGAYYLGYLGLCLIRYQTQIPIDWTVYKWLSVSGVLTLLAYPFIPLLAKLFGFVSSITLNDLADLSNPLLKDLSINAPGTLQHSLQVANLCEAAADKIGANGVFVKVGALYHDIGKLHNPAIYIENQNGINPHDHLTNFESARAIIDHIPEGVKRAKKAGLPQPIIDLITTHHGTTRVEYFYRNQMNNFPDQDFDQTLFMYPGPKPITREQTILMIADSVEAASKSLKNPTGQDIDNLVDQIVSYKIKNDQLSESQLSFEELGNCVSVFKSLLRNINHVRVEYPTEK